MPTKKLALLLMAAGLVLPGCSGPAEPADLILFNGKIVTVEDDTGTVSALAARAGRIVALGDDSVVEPLRGAKTRVIDLAGRLAVPGFIEGHAHFTGLGEALMNVDLRPARSYDELIEIVAAAARSTPAGEWIRGRGWHQEKWDSPVEPSVEGYPVHEALSRAVPDHPVSLRHASGHATLANALALERAGIGTQTPDPAGGKILRDASGRATGVLRETAAGLLRAAIGQDETSMTGEEHVALLRRQVTLAANECLSKGLTSFQDAGSSLATVDLLREMAEAGEIGIRLWVMLREDNETLEARLADYRMIDVADHHLTVRAIKQAIDGALGSHGAWLLEPYSDQPGSAGLNTTALYELERTAELAAEHDFQLCVHAIGDRGNRETLDLFERTFEGHPEMTDPRWRIEHAQHLHADDVPRFAELGVIASMQGIHCTSDGPWVPLRVGAERAESGAYLWRELIDSGAIVTNGTDAPVEDVSPLASYYASVSRRIRDGGTFFEDQRMTRMEALRSYTINAAHAAFEESTKGSLALGKLADVTVLSRDILTIDEGEIPSTKVLFTIVGGEVRYESPDL